MCGRKINMALMDIVISMHGFISLKGSETTVFLSIDLIDCLRFMKKAVMNSLLLRLCGILRKCPP